MALLLQREGSTCPHSESLWKFNVYNYKINAVSENLP